MIVLDASVLIAFLDSDDAHHVRAEALLIREVDDDFAINSLALAEVLVVPARDDRIDEVRATLDELEVRELSFPAGAGAQLAKLCADTNLKMPDCCVLLAAEQVNARVASFDDRLGELPRRAASRCSTAERQGLRRALNGPVQRSACEAPSSAVSATTVGSKREMPYWIRLDRAAD